MNFRLFAPVFAVATLVAASCSLKAESPLAQTLAGTWACSVEITPPVPPGALAKYPGAITFFADGSLLGQSADNDGAAISHGIWLRTGDGQFRSTWLGFYVDGNARRLVGPYKVFYNFKLGPDLNVLRGAYRVDFFDTNGGKLFAFSGKAECKRLEVEAFDDQPQP